MIHPTHDRESLARLRLIRSDGIGPRSYFKLLRRFGTAERALAELPGLIARWGVGERLRLCPEEVVLAERERMDREGWRFLDFDDPHYPESLAAIPDPPPVLALRGRMELLGRPAVAMVGARNASGNGRVLARTWAAELARHGLIVVSGLARGIDAAAHEGALTVGGGTIAVIASGIDIAYPPENQDLQERIGADGLIVSERPLGAVPKARHFPRRNRLISGLSQGVVVVEAAPHSGSLITARMALEQGREVMAVPGSPLDPRHHGTNRLLRDGATLVENADDILQALAGPLRRPAPRPADVEPVLPREPIVEPDAELIERIRACLGPEPLLVDELIRQCHASAAEVQQALLELELVGRVERHPGNRVALAQG